MKSRKNGYTLLEIIIVLGVIAVIMTITMRFSSSRIDDLKAQTSKDDFKNNYEQLLLSNISSNYHNKERYTKLTITIQSGKNGFNYNLQNDNSETKSYTGFFDNAIKVTQITVNNENPEKLDIELLPYKIGCKINNSTGSATIQTQAKNKNHCFKVTTNICKLENTPCSEF